MLITLVSTICPREDSVFKLRPCGLAYDCIGAIPMLEDLRRFDASGSIRAVRTDCPTSTKITQIRISNLAMQYRTSSEAYRLRGEYLFWFHNIDSKHYRQECLFRSGHFYQGCSDVRPQAELSWSNRHPFDVHMGWADWHWHLRLNQQLACQDC
jgi:hypothetical protein